MIKILDQLAGFIEHVSEWAGRFSAWLVLAMVLLIAYDVMMRYLFQSGSVALQELEWHIFALIFLLGAAYTLKHDAHVRVDVVYQSRLFSDKARAWVDLLGALLFLIPFCLLVINGSLPFVENSFYLHERSPDPGGLPFRYFLKAAIPFGFTLLLLQGVALVIRNAQKLCCPALQDKSQN